MNENTDNTTETMSDESTPVREAAPRKRGRKPGPKAEKEPREPRAAYEPGGLVLAALEAINAVRDDNDALFDKKGIAQIVKTAVELRDLGKAARLRAGDSEAE
jgi:hypothetical protein